MNIDIGDAVVVRANRVVGIVYNMDRGRALAWVVWPDNSGMSEVVALGALQIIKPRAEIMSALQALQPIGDLFTSTLLSPASAVVIDQISNAEPRYSRLPVR